MSALICVDIGNSTIGFGLFIKPSKKRKPFIKKIPTFPKLSSEKYKELVAEFIKKKYNPIKDSEIDSVLSSVVSDIDSSVIKALKDITGKPPLIVNHKLNTGILFDIKRPEKIGSDRIAGAVAAFELFKNNLALIDLGTATTITVIKKGDDQKPIFLGGTIMPGLNLMKDSLYKGTSKLPLIKVKKPQSALGKDTITAINSGIIFGTAGAIKNIIKNVEKEYGFRLKLILSGGYASFISPFLGIKHHFMPDIIFEGLRLIYLRIKNNA
jgi:type III pantothenate kinase